MKLLFKVLGVLAYFVKYRRTQFWTKTSIEDYQFSRLKSQLIWAGQTKYYKKLFEKIDFDPRRDFSEIGDLNRVPITEKNLVRASPNDFINNRWNFLSLVFRTSGSTGRPLKARIYFVHWIIEQAVIFRHWQWAGYKRSQKTAMLRSYSPKRGEPLFKYNWILNTYYFSPFHLDDGNMQTYYDIMVKKGISVIRGYPSSIKIFASFLQRKSLKGLKVNIIFTASETLTDSDRFFIESVFNAKVSNHYGLAEQIVMMGDCEEHTHLHNYFEYGFLELIDTEIPNVKRIVGTNLHNRTMPLLRYDTGDLAIVDSTVCGCNRNLLSIKGILGRHDLLIDCPNGFQIPSVNFYTLMEGFSKVTQWQIVFDSTFLVLKYATVESLDYREKDTLLTGLRDRLVNSGFNISIQETQEFERKFEGKVPVIVKLT